jgi:hypothetical protein
MWNVIGNISSVITLVAFLGALIVSVYRRRAHQLEVMVKSIPRERREALVESMLDRVSVNTTALSREQKYDLAVRVIEGRSRRFRILTVAIIVIAALAAALTGFAFWNDKVVDQRKPPDSFDTSESASREEISSLVKLEARLAAGDSRSEENAKEYGELFASDAVIEDVGHHKFWIGQGDIMNRFRGLQRFPMLDHKLAESPKINEDTATAQTESTVVLSAPAAGESAANSGHEVWTFEKVQGKWKIQKLRFNMPPSEH